MRIYEERRPEEMVLLHENVTGYNYNSSLTALKESKVYIWRETQERWPQTIEAYFSSLVVFENW